MWAFRPDNENLSWTKGIELVVNGIANINQSCDYIFTHDDDLTFRIKQQFCIPEISLPNMLINVLKTYRPAIVGFPWAIGDRRISAMKELVTVYENETIAPLTGFDNGMVIYHKSVINLFIPFSPQGEGSFRGKWTLCAQFLQMFAHLLFGKYAIRFNMFEYNNSINMDNTLPENHFKQRIVIKNGLAYVHNSRHPYEYPQNEAYRAFLSDGLKFPYQSWGRTLNTEYRLETLKATDLKRKSFDGLWLLERLNRVYDVRHEALSNNKLLHDQFTNKQKLRVLQETHFSLKLILLTMNRLTSFERLWKSLTKALPINRTIEIFIHVDMDKNDNKRRKYLEYLSSLRSLHGNVHVVAYSERRGLKTLMIEAWRPLNNDEFYPHNEIRTDCIINMDDDWDMPYSHMAFAIDTWRGHFFKNLVGYSHLGCNHVPTYVNSTFQYVYSNKLLLSKKGAFYSMVLPSGFVYHRRYLYQYTYELPQIARDLVDSLKNCDDILLNFLIANTTKQGPVVIDTFAKAYNFGGLWKRSTQIETRTLCLNKFVKIFGGMPLKYTTTVFKINRNQTVPGRNKHHFQARMPTK
ncbi:unnamed protein product [Rotaria sp. Silwood2]|nr:unnamed protein product [Rotaria sp. Silwood2]CAF4494500.1 unnamed protein product [Rotaria sp. Silwood2]